MKKLTKLLVLMSAFAAVAVTTLAIAQTPPTNVYGLSIFQNDSQPVCSASKLCLKLNASGVAQWSYDGGSYSIGAQFGSQSASFALMGPAGASGIPTFRQITQDDIGAAFTVTFAASGFSTSQACGSTISNPQFTITHNQNPVTATCQDNTDTQSISPATLTTIGYGGAASTFSARSYTVTTVAGSRTWTLVETNAGGVIQTKTVTATWNPHIYFSMATPATINSAFITALLNSGGSPASPIVSTNAAALNRNLTYAAGNNTQKAYFALPATYTQPTNFIDVSTGFGIPFSQVGTNISVTDECGTGNNINYNVYATDNLLDAGFTGKWS